MKRYAGRIAAIFAVGLGAAGAAAPAAAQTFTDWSAPESLGPALNTAATDGCPFIAKNDLTLYFASNRPGGLGGLDIYVSRRDSPTAPWQPPQNVTSVNTPANELCPTLTIDGHRLLFVSDRPNGCGAQDLYVAWRRNKRDEHAWEPAENLGCEVNSPQNDFTPSYGEDDATGEAALYFSSARPGLGGTDIYVSIQQADGTFGAASLVEELSTPFDDQRPNVRRDGLEIFFDSNRNGSSDLWTSTRAHTDEPWSPPVRLDAPVNTSSMEGRPSLSFHGDALYFMSNRPGSTPTATCAPSIDLYVTRRDRVGGTDE